MQERRELQPPIPTRCLAGHPSFNALQNFDAAHTAIVYYVFDVLVLSLVAI